jgi:hypothetical protein
MMQFTVSQFIDVEDKIFGPITTRQFVILLGGFMVIAVCYKLFDFSLFVTLGLIILAISGVFAFLKINGMPFHFFVLNFLQTVKRPGLRVWNNSIAILADREEAPAPEIIETKTTQFKMVSTSRLAELSLIVDTRGAYRGDSTGQNITAINKKNNQIN